MALAFASVKEGVDSDRQYRIYDVTLDAAYPTGGYPVTAANFNLPTSIITIQPSNTSAGLPVVWDAAASKLKILDVNDAGGAAGHRTFQDAAANSANITASHTIRVRVTGY